MSRIGKSPIAVPNGVDVQVNSNLVTVKGPKGELAQKIHESMVVSVDNGEISVSRSSDEKQARALHGLTRSLIENMVLGVTEGYVRELEIRGVGYRASLQGNKLVLQVGYSHNVDMEAPNGIEFEVPAPTRIIVKGIDKRLVGETAANIRAVRKPEPYLGKGIKYAGERIRRKAGKAGKAAGD